MTKEEKAAYSKAYQEANKDKIKAKKKAKKKAYYEANHKKILAKNKVYREANCEEKAVYNKKYVEIHREQILAQKKAYYQANQDKILAEKKAYYIANKDIIKVRRKAYCEANWVKLASQEKAYLKTNIKARIARRLRHRLWQALKNNQKAGSAVCDLGCTVGELKQHLELQFQGGMTWENYGEWHIDHIIPLSSFDLTNREQFLIACNYTNLQPLWAIDNIRKGNCLPVNKQ